jgi:phosphonatase-like hydrolase
MITLVLFDMAGTTVDDRVGGNPLVIGATLRALGELGLELTPAQVSAQRGQEKQAMLRVLLDEAGADPALLDAAYEGFLRELSAGLDGVSEMPGARETFAWLRERGIRVGVGSGFPTDVVERIVQRLGWRQAGLIDYAASSQQVGASRPDPAMVLDAMSSLGIDDPRHVVKVGDTAMDVLEGRNAGVWTVAVRSGTQSEAQLAQHGPDAILPDVAALPAWLRERGLV